MTLKSKRGSVWTLEILLSIVSVYLLIGNHSVWAQEGTTQPPPTLSEPSPPEKEPKPDQKQKEEETLQLEEPTLAPPPKEEPPSLGPVSNITFGGLLDFRYIPGPRTLDTGSGFLVIHATELVATANIGENISVLAELLLVTSGLEEEVGQDHGFVYATFTNIPLLPSDLSFRIGRFRMRYGIDAVMDASINPVRTLVYKSIVSVSDRGLELSYFWRWFEISAAVVNGPDEKTVDEPETGASLKVGSGNRNRPVAVRGSIDIPGGPQVGLSYFHGNSYVVENSPGFDPDTMIFNAKVDTDILVEKDRYTVDAKYSIRRFDFAGEYTFGTDEFTPTELDVEGYYFRSDVTLLPRKLKWLFQYDLWKDGDSFTSDDPAFSTAATYYMTDESLLRAAYLLNLEDTGTYATIIQLLLTF